MWSYINVFLLIVKNLNYVSSLYASQDMYNRNRVMWTRKSFLKICLRTSCISLHLDTVKIYAIKYICFLLHTIAPVGTLTKK